MPILLLALALLQTPGGQPFSESTLEFQRMAPRVSSERQAIVINTAAPPAEFCEVSTDRVEADMTIQDSLGGPGLDAPLDTDKGIKIRHVK